MSIENNKLYNDKNNTIKDKEDFGRGEIDSGNAKFMDSLVNVNKMYYNLESSLKEFSKLKPNTNRNVKGLGYLQEIDLGVPAISFTIDNMNDKGTIFAIDANGDLITHTRDFDTAKEKTTIRNRDPKSNPIQISRLHNFNMGFIHKLSGLGDSTYMESVDSENNDIKWSPVNFGDAKIEAIDFTVFSSRHFFCNLAGGITQTGGKSIESSESDEKPVTIFTNIKFQACVIDGPNKKLYALDKESKGNNLYIFDLDNNLEFIKSQDKLYIKNNQDGSKLMSESNNYNHSIVKPNIPNLYLNNITIVPRSNPNIINGNEIELVFVGSKVDDNSGKVNLYSGKIFYGSGEIPQAKCEWNGWPLGVVGKCGDQIVSEWGLGATKLLVKFNWIEAPEDNYPGNDMVGDPPLGSSLDACKAACAADADCKGIVYGNHYNLAPGAAGNQCFKKSDMSRGVSGAGFTSYYKKINPSHNDPYAGEVNINKNIGNCNYAIQRGLPMGAGGIVVDCATMRNRTLELTKLVDNDFSGIEYIKFKKDQDFSNPNDKLYNMVVQSINKMSLENAKTDSRRFIDLELSQFTGDILVLLDGVLLKYPLYNLGAQNGITTFREYIEFPIEEAMEQMNELYTQFNKIENTNQFLDEKVIGRRNKELLEQVNLVKKEMKLLNSVQKEHERLEGTIKLGNRNLNMLNTQLIFWSILTIISIIFIVLHFVNEKLVPTWVLITYIIFIIIVILISRGYFSQSNINTIENKMYNIFN